MIKNFRVVSSAHISRNRIKYFFLCLCLLAGIVIGALLVSVLTGGRQGEMTEFVESYCSQMVQEQINSTEIFGASLISNVRIYILLLLCSCYYAFIPVAFGIVAVKGFSMGFTMGFFTWNYGGKGLVLSLVSILPQAILLIPCMLFLALIAVNHAYDKHKQINVRSTPVSISSNNTARLIFYFAAGGVLLLLSSLIDGFIAPVFIKSVCNLFVI